ncbi:uncharacterized protein LOC133843733 isoform X1 [Drosophila sulfurigaster albostrigata]|uniref:uncharacterized protein LOC132791168 isoform X1 n=1 Tax=Drosophila nasuta TaxID=42062 RepID=UPI00295F52EB|nr:uncharacterized protein LOC132791168 isoform X1 [Drosophila nasuta]XP_062133381.1 uncharacterized protein LOC133843733 isoform X1 [Drosophila sulfurigaster albostrigata]
MPKVKDMRVATLLLLLTVFNAYAPMADGQSYLLTLENVLTRQLPYNLTTVNGTSDADLFAEQVDNNTRIFVYKNTVVESNNELSQTAMDVITIVWYVATFLALAAFFMLMACSDRRCRDMRNRQASATPNEQQRAPPTPSPSYSEFAPPSYDTVIKMQHAAKTSIFVIPFNSDNKTNDDATNISPVSTDPASVYTIDERPKATK